MDRTNKHRYETERDNGSKRRRMSEEPKKDTHNKCEQKGRQKINDKINELKDLLPECQNSAANKAAILRSASDSIKRFQFICYQLFASNMKIEEENAKIREEISRLRGAIGLPATENLSSFDGHSGRSNGGDVPIIKPEMVDPSRFMSNASSMRPQDHFNFLYSTPVGDSGRPSYKIVPGGPVFTDPSQFMHDDEKDKDSSSMGFPGWK